MRRFTHATLGIFSLWLLLGCGDDSPPTLPTAEKPSVTVTTTIPNEIKIATLKLDLLGSPLYIEIQRDGIYTQPLANGNIIFGVVFEGVMRATKNYKIEEFSMSVEPIKSSTPLSPNPELGSFGVYYPKVLAAGQQGTFAWWQEYFTDESLFYGFTYRIMITAKEISPMDVKEEGVVIK